MIESFLFHPPRRRGVLIQAVAGSILASLSAFSFLGGLRQTAGVDIVLFFSLSLLFFAPLPLIVYRAYALLRASYRLERDGLRLRWGLRAEDIALPEIEWIHRASDLTARLPSPPLAWPGAYLGAVKVRSLGMVEYMASSRDTLLLIAARGKVYAISPENPDLFLRAFQQVFEMGSLQPISSTSIMPAAFISHIWENRLARLLIVASFLLVLALFAGAGLVIPGRESISIGFYPNGEPLPPVPAGQVLLLPILGSFIFVFDLVAGFFLYRRAETHLAALMIWGCGLFTEVLFLAALIQLSLTPI